MTEQEMADEIISYGDGAFSLCEPEGWENLDAEGRIRVMNMVYEELYACDSCGWWHNLDSMDNFPDRGETVCCSCASDYYDEDEEE